MISKIDKQKMRTWVEIDRKALKHNFTNFKNMVSKNCIVMSVVKSNAYGHGLLPVSKELVKLGVQFLGVDSFPEALELREANIKTRIMVFGYTAPAYYKEAAEKNISLTISNMPALLALSKIKTAKKIKIHIKADTGLGRQGFQMNEMEDAISQISKLKNVEVEGIYSHLAVGEDPKQKAYTQSQVDKLNMWEARLKQEGYKPLKHICATSSTMLFPEFHFDMVRIGIGTYGLWPSKETKQAIGKKYELKPVLSWKAIITEIKTLKKGRKIGYDLTEELKKNSVLAVVPVGYWHGYPRLLSGKGTFSLHGQKVKLVGRVSMDMIVIDVTGVGSVKIGDEIAIIGGDHGHYAEADVMAQDADTINYEITTRINPIIKRFYRLNPTMKRYLV